MDQETLSKASQIDRDLNTLLQDFGPDSPAETKFNSVHVENYRGLSKCANHVLSKEEKELIGLIVQNAVERNRRNLTTAFAAL